MSIYDKSSLVLIPSGTKTGKVYSQVPTNGDGDFTFTRSSAATRVNADGNIEKETGNAIPQSNNFNTTWNAVNASVTSGQAGYDGTSDAWLLSKSAAHGNININLPSSSSDVHTFSLYAKANASDWMRMTIGSPRVNVFFNVANGTLGEVSPSAIDTNIESVGNGWYRVSFSTTYAAWVEIFPAETFNDTGGTSGSLYIQDAQVEQGLVARDYIETTTSAVYGGITDNVPRLDYTDSSCPALLLEPSRRNAMPHSEYINTIDFSKSANVVFTNNYAVSPEGVENATRVQFGATGSNEIFYDRGVGNYGKKNTTSFYVKGTSGQTINTYIDGTSSTAGYYFFQKDVTLTGDWQRVENTFDLPLNAGASNFVIRRRTTDLATEILLYGYEWQVDTAGGDASYATSYIPTYGSSVTRNLETCNVNSVSNVPTAYPFVINVEAYHTLNTTTGAIGFYDNSNQYYYYSIQLGSNNKIVAESRPEGVTQNIVSSSSTYTEGFHKIAVLFENNTTMKIYIDGALQGTKTDCVNNSFNTGFSDYVIGVYRSINTNPCSIRNIKIFNTALSNEELIALTTI